MITEEQFVAFGCTPIDMPGKIHEVVAELYPDLHLTRQGADKLYLCVMRTLLAERIREFHKHNANNPSAEKGVNEKQDIATVTDWLNQATIENKYQLPITFRFGHVGSWFMPGIADASADKALWVREWDDADAPTEQDLQVFHAQYETLRAGGAFDTPCMLIQLNWSGLGWGDNELFWRNSTQIENALQDAHWRELWQKAQDVHDEAALNGAYMTDFYKTFSTPNSSIFKRLEKGNPTYTVDDYAQGVSSTLRNEDVEALAKTPCQAVDSFGLLVAGDDITEDANARKSVRIYDIILASMLYTLMIEAKMLHVDAPIMIPVGKTVVTPLLQKSTKLLAGSATLRDCPQYPFIKGAVGQATTESAIDRTYQDISLMHPSGANGHWPEWVADGRAVRSLDEIVDMMQERRENLEGR